MVQALNLSDEAEVVAVASRTQMRAETFGRQWNIPVRYGIASHAHIGQTGVDELDSILLSYETGATADLNCSMRIYKPMEAFIIGSKGYIKVHDIFFAARSLDLAPQWSRAADL